MITHCRIGSGIQPYTDKFRNVLHSAPACSMACQLARTLAALQAATCLRAHLFRTAVQIVTFISEHAQHARPITVCAVAKDIARRMGRMILTHGSSQIAPACYRCSAVRHDNEVSSRRSYDRFHILNRPCSNVAAPAAFSGGAARYCRMEVLQF